jgi:hypothetical protein
MHKLIPKKGRNIKGRIPVKCISSLKNAVLWDVMLCASYKNRHFRGTYCLCHQGEKNERARNNISSNQQMKHACEYEECYLLG